MERKFILKKDKPDSRDIIFKAEKLNVDKAKLPLKYDLRDLGLLPDILDQGEIGSCGPNHISNSMKYCLKKFNFKGFQPSRLFIYYFTRLLEDSPLDEDTGISIRGGLKASHKYSTCGENHWGYDVSEFTIKPIDPAIKASTNHMEKFKYIRIPQNLHNIKQTLYAGFPIITGIQIYDSFTSDKVAKTGKVDIPLKNEEHLGGHCVSIIGYDDNSERFILANSWGKEWGNRGYFTLPYNYILNNKLASDFWIIVYFHHIYKNT